MALSGSIKTNSYDGRYYTLSWSAAQSVANNQSTIYWTLSCAGGSAWYAERTLYAVIAGHVVANKTDRVQRYAGTISSGSFTVNHAADGSASFTAELKVAVYYSSVNCTASGSFTLDTIPRATTPTLSSSSVYMSGAVTINTPRASTAFTHDLAYSFAGGDWVSIATGVATSKTWAVPDLATAIPNATSGTMTIRCITKNGSTTIGTKTVLLTVKVPEWYAPAVSTVTLEEATEGLADQFGAFIQGKSKVKATITAEGSGGSTIASYQTAFQGLTYTGGTWTSEVLQASGTLTMTVKVTDSRGRQASKDVTLDVLAYTKPAITTFMAYRCNAEAVEDHSGEYVLTTYAYSTPALNGGNTASMIIQRKQSSEPDTETNWETMYGLSELSREGTFVLPGFSPDNQWDVRLSVTDWFGSTNTYTVIVPTEEVILDIKADGKTVSFGKVAEAEGALEVALRGVFKKDAHFEQELTYTVPVKHTDLNQMVTSGKFYIGPYSQNRPSEVNGWLDVSSYTESNCYQVYVTYLGDKYERWLIDGEWGPWIYLDYVIERGTSGIWTYEKWASGKAECWGCYTASGVNVAANNYSGFYYSQSIDVRLPLDFTTIDDYQVNGGSADRINLARVFGAYPSTDNVSFVICGHQAAATSVSISVYLSVKGTWK